MVPSSILTCGPFIRHAAHREGHLSVQERFGRTGKLALGISVAILGSGAAEGHHNGSTCQAVDVISHTCQQLLHTLARIWELGRQPFLQPGSDAANVLVLGRGEQGQDVLVDLVVGADRCSCSKAWQGV